MSPRQNLVALIGLVLIGLHYWFSDQRGAIGGTLFGSGSGPAATFQGAPNDPRNGALIGAGGDPPRSEQRTGHPVPSCDRTGHAVPVRERDRKDRRAVNAHSAIVQLGAVLALLVVSIVVAGESSNAGELMVALWATLLVLWLIHHFNP